MGLLRGAMTVRRFRVVGDLSEGWRERFRERLNAEAFRESVTGQGKEEVEGWVQVHNLLDTSFDDFNTWLYGDYVVFSLRVDKKTLPAKLLRAHVDKRCRAWCEERGIAKVPGSIKQEIKEKLEDEWLDRMLPRVALIEVIWNLEQGYVVIDSLSDKNADRIRKRFHRTFGFELLPWSPLDALADASARETLMNTTPAFLGGDA